MTEEEIMKEAQRIANERVKKEEEAAFTEAETTGTIRAD